jgi:tRNA (mo5U34)-methyltransferase
MNGLMQTQSASQTLRELRRRQNDFAVELTQKGWFHSFELPDGSSIQGCMSMAWQQERWARFPIPADLRGKRVIDIGSWDGWFSFEAERRGAEVTSVDCVEIPNYLYIHRKLSSKAVYRNLDVYEIPAANLGKFDFVLLLGILYHLKHPLLALEIVCRLATEVAVIETFVTDGATWREHQEDIPTLEFYETDELNGNFDNWFAPSVGCLLAMCRAAGFARVELLAADKDYASVACFRKWEPEPAEPGKPPPELLAAVSTRDFGINFSSERDEYIACWFRAEKEAIARTELRLEVGEFGAPAVFVRWDERDAWHANFRLPPGAVPGWNTVRLRLKNSRFSNTLRIAVNMPPVVEQITVKDVFDGLSWQRGEVRVNGEEAYITCWVQGLPDNSDFSNVKLWLGEQRLRITYMGEPDSQGYRQVNAAVSRDYPKGKFPFSIESGGVSSAAIRIQVI